MSPVLEPDSAGRRWSSAGWGGQESGGWLHIFVTHRPGPILEWDYVFFNVASLALAYRTDSE